jgi:uncharacterized membrane protein YhaH (DUF805 family)
MKSSKPVFEDLFKFSGRRNRKSYLLYQLASFIGLSICVFLGVLSVSKLEGTSFYLLGWAIGSVFFIAFLAIALSAWITSAQRCRDIGWAGWVCLIQLVPYIGWLAGLVIAIAVGDSYEDNKYGKSCINTGAIK